MSHNSDMNIGGTIAEVQHEGRNTIVDIGHGIKTTVGATEKMGAVKEGGTQGNFTQPENVRSVQVIGHGSSNIPANPAGSFVTPDGQPVAVHQHLGAGMVATLPNGLQVPIQQGVDMGLIKEGVATGSPKAKPEEYLPEQKDGEPITVDVGKHDLSAGVDLTKPEGMTMAEALTQDLVDAVQQNLDDDVEASAEDVLINGVEMAMSDSTPEELQLTIDVFAELIGGDVMEELKEHMDASLVATAESLGYEYDAVHAAAIADRMGYAKAALAVVRGDAGTVMTWLSGIKR